MVDYAESGAASAAITNRANSLRNRSIVRPVMALDAGSRPMVDRERAEGRGQRAEGSFCPHRFAFCPISLQLDSRHLGLPDQPKLSADPLLDSRVHLGI